MDDKAKKIQSGCIGCFGIVFIAVILIIIIAIFTSGDSEKKLKAFDFTADEYEVALKTVIDKVKGNSFIEMKPKEKTDEGYGIALTNGIFVFLSVDDKDKVTSVGLSASSSIFMWQSKEVVMAIESIIKSVDDTLSVPQRLITMEKLGITGNADMLDRKESYTINDVEYTYVGDIEGDKVMFLARVK